MNSKNKNPIFKHFIITRFLCINFNHTNEELFSDAWLQNAFKLTKSHFIPTLENQTNRNFEVVFLIHDDIPFEKVEALERIDTSVRFHIIRNKYLDVFLNTYKDKTDFLITSRLDYDDNIHKSVVDDIQKYAIENYGKITIYGLNLGSTIKDGEYTAYKRDIPKYEGNQGYFSIMETLILPSNMCESYFSIYKLGNHTNVIPYLRENAESLGIQKLNNDFFYKDTSDEIKYLWVRHNMSQSVMANGIWHTSDEKVSLNLKDDFGYQPQMDSESIIDTQIFVLCYKNVDYTIPKNSLYTPLQCGAEIFKEDVCEAKDNIGDSISERNPYYAEVTGTYWIWKNAAWKYRYIGQCQYRRQMLFGETEDFNTLFGKYDAILGGRIDFDSSVYEQYKRWHNIDDLDAIGRIISELFPQYADDYERYILNGNVLYSHAGFVMKSEDFHKYCEFLFTLIHAHEKMFNINGIGDIERHIAVSPKGNGNKKQRFVYGFLAERILTLFAFHNFKNILDFPYILMEDELKPKFTSNEVKKWFASITKSTAKKPFFIR